MTGQLGNRGVSSIGQSSLRNDEKPGAEQAAEKLNTGGAIDEKHASGAEARIEFAVFAARLKSRPDTKLTTPGAFPQPVKPICFAAFAARLKRIPQGRKNPLGSR
jgi:hypothetical protein